MEAEKQFWQQVKREVFSQMDQNKMTPERAREILAFIRSGAVANDSKVFFEKFPELSRVSETMITQELEQLEGLKTALVEILLTEDGFEEGAEFIGKLNNAGDSELVKILEDFRDRYPVEYQKISDHFQEMKGRDIFADLIKDPPETYKLQKSIFSDELDFSLILAK